MFDCVQSGENKMKGLYIEIDGDMHEIISEPILIPINPDGQVDCLVMIRNLTTGLTLSLDVDEIKTTYTSIWKDI